MVKDIMSESPSAIQENEEYIASREKDTYLHVFSKGKDSSEQPRSCVAPAEEIETIARIAEMISCVKRATPDRISALSECCPKTKKQRQVLISQKLEKSLAISNIAGSQADNASSQPNNEEAINLTTAAAVIENTDEKCRFEEVEIKLEEMFAGIEDEQCAVGSSKDCQQSPKTIGCKPNSSICDLSNPKEKKIATKAAIKAADPVPDIIKCTDIKSLPPRRRLSLALQAQSQAQSQTRPQTPVLTEKLSLLCSSEKDGTKDMNLTINNNSSVRAGNNSGNHTNARKKNKSFGNKRKRFSENKKGKMQNVKQKKKTLTKLEEASTKMKGLKFKNRRPQNSSSSDSENDQDEKAQQTIDAKYRSPYVLIKNDGTISVVNTTTTDESSDKNNKTKRSGYHGPERRNVRGIYSSTLSNKYDADTADSTWICVFCKRGPHKKGLGDLFGPYVINIDSDEFKNAQDVKDKPLSLTASSSKRKRNDMPYKTTTPPIGTQSSKSEVEESSIANNNCVDEKRVSSPRNFFPGMSRMTSNSYEIWFHEDCAVWAPNLYIVGSRLVGLDSGICQSMFHTCVCCMQSGAIICCLQRDCKETAHVPCARENSWNLNESKFWSHCAKHAPKYDSTIQKQLLCDTIKLPC